MTGDGQHNLEIKPVESRRDLRAFLEVPYRVFKDDPHWVPPLKSEVRKQLTPGRNAYFDHAEARYWIAERDGETVGRISAQVDDLAVETLGRKIGHFGFIDAIDDDAVFAGLFSAAEEWLRYKGMEIVQGPFNLSINEETGLLIDGFDSDPVIMMGHARPYYHRRIADLGYEKAKDLYAYEFSVSDGFPDKINKLVERIASRGQVTLRMLDMKNYKRDLADIIDIFNDAWSGNWGFVPLTKAEAEQAAQDMKPLIRDDWVYIAEVEGRPVAMMINLPNLNEVIKDLDGRLFPAGWAKLLWRLKFHRFKTSRVAMMGVRREYQNTALGAGLAFMLIEQIWRNGLAYGLERGELSWILEDNEGMKQMLSVVGSQIYKTYRVFEKAL